MGIVEGIGIAALVVLVIFLVAVFGVGGGAR